MLQQSPRDIAVWRIDLSFAGDLTAWYEVLDTDEQVRADRFRFAEHRRRFIVAHAAVRSILSTRLGLDPKDIRFDTGSHGKPFLAGRDSPLFSLSHSHEMALCAVVDAGELGVDIEWCRELPHADLARRFFSPEEAAALELLPEVERQKGFFACWTSKEAYIKAKGLGLSLPLDSFVVVADPCLAPGLLSSRHEPSDVGPYCFWEVPVLPGYRAALAYRGDDTIGPCYIDWASPF